MTGNWDDFYSLGHLRTPSPFGVAVVARLREVRPAAVVDLGCGNGRDTLHLNDGGRCVVGVDVSEVGITAARASATEEGSAHWRAPRFICADLSTDAAWAGIEAQIEAGEAEGLRAYYGRFLLHALGPEPRMSVLRHLASAMRDGDLALFEFRTLLDAGLPKMRQHTRWFVDPHQLEGEVMAVGLRLRIDAAGTGLARWGLEDPHVARVTMTKE